MLEDELQGKLLIFLSRFNRVVVTPLQFGTSRHVSVANGIVLVPQVPLVNIIIVGIVQGGNVT